MEDIEQLKVVDDYEIKLITNEIIKNNNLTESINVNYEDDEEET